MITINEDTQDTYVKGTDAMNGLLENGLGLMILGMGFVFLFLVVLIYATGFMSTFIHRFFPDLPDKLESPAIKQSNSRQVASSHSTMDSKVVVAITAAIHQHRNK
ncbi:oxaloacetate decarboxylase gamma chain [Marinomonas spartinae]|uniref:Probable oxaloacetate decarboxylase gamma chain n=1 Tax=Marinomonas spartinae TaxID=1792290 RepID=A0A1A8TVV2_9GAMM|nr:OadG family protein [Marinomonas spartinae]SBS37963.1 oxaloacetate decarboxylase gamma chain [Marinomonas spartinae]